MKWHVQDTPSDFCLSKTKTAMQISSCSMQSALLSRSLQQSSYSIQRFLDHARQGPLPAGDEYTGDPIDVSVTIAYILAFIRCLVDAGSRTLSGYGNMDVLRFS
jgi:hypothetical protein